MGALSREGMDAGAARSDSNPASAREDVGDGEDAEGKTFVVRPYDDEDEDEDEDEGGDGDSDGEVVSAQEALASRCPLQR